MPVRRIVQQWVDWAGRNVVPLLTFLLFLCVVFLIVAIAGWTRARDAENRVTKVEVARAAEKATADANEVGLCLSRARNGPDILHVFRAIASTTSGFDRKFLQEQVDAYAAGIPSHSYCVNRANVLKIDWESIEQRQLRQAAQVRSREQEPS